MDLEIDDETGEFIREHRVARLATVDAEGRPAVVPICYVFDGERIYSPIDEKPKSVDAKRLKRVRNIEVNPQVSLVIDDYSEDWSKLAYVILGGMAELMEPEENADERTRVVQSLRDKYPQYRSMAIDRRPIIRITPTRIKRWKSR